MSEHKHDCVKWFWEGQGCAICKRWFTGYYTMDAKAKREALIWLRKHLDAMINQMEGM